MELKPKDRFLYAEMRGIGVLQDIDGHRLPQQRGVILVCCADGDRFCDIFQHQRKVMETWRGDSRIHCVSLNGGALRLVKSSPMNSPGHTTSLDICEDIRAARAMKNINTVALYAHTPCGMATQYRLDILDVAMLLVEAKNTLKEAIAGIKVACFMHVHDRKGRSYFLSRQQLEEHAMKLMAIVHPEGAT